MNEITNRENSDEFLRLMRARSQVYWEASHFQTTQLILTVAIPLITGVVGTFVPDVRPYAGSLSVFLTLLDVFWLDRHQRTKLKIAARISEQFDTGVLELPWNTFMGKPIDPELIARASEAWKKGDAKLRDWYSPSVSKASIALGRILCQRANLRYDCELRKIYGNILLGLALVIVAILVVIALFNHFTLVDWALTTFAPSAPILVWAARERFRQIDTGMADDAMRSGVEALWEQTSTGKISEQESTARARTLQDAIFAHRSSSPLIFPLIYNRVRNRLEREMHAGIDELLRNAGIT